MTPYTNYQPSLAEIRQELVKINAALYTATTSSYWQQLMDRRKELELEESEIFTNLTTQAMDSIARNPPPDENECWDEVETTDD